MSSYNYVNFSWDDAKAAALPALTKLDADLKAIKYADGESATNRQMMSTSSALSSGRSWRQGV